MKSGFRRNVHCEFYNSSFKIDDEVKHHKLDDMEKSGYEFEKGRIRAQQRNQLQLVELIIKVTLVQRFYLMKQ